MENALAGVAGKKFILSYSCGKDSTLCLHKMLEAGAEPMALLVMFNPEAGRSYFHGVDPALLREYGETVVLLSKLKVDHHIEIELKMDELDLTAAESKATYDEIKAYVLNKYGLKVSQLYIAQIKRKCGIIERKNYNVSKKEDAKVPQCPPEKEAAIMDALKHFQMI